MNKIFIFNFRQNKFSSVNLNIAKHLYKHNFHTFAAKVKMDPYLILEVNRSSDWKTIKKSYFKLARLYHPDLNKNDEVYIVFISKLEGEEEIFTDQRRV